MATSTDAAGMGQLSGSSAGKCWQEAQVEARGGGGRQGWGSCSEHTPYPWLPKKHHRGGVSITLPRAVRREDRRCRSLQTSGQPSKPHCQRGGEEGNNPSEGQPRRTRPLP